MTESTLPEVLRGIPERMLQRLQDLSRQYGPERLWSRDTIGTAATLAALREIESCDLLVQSLREFLSRAGCSAFLVDAMPWWWFRWGGLGGRFECQLVLTEAGFRTLTRRVRATAVGPGTLLESGKVVRSRRPNKHDLMEVVRSDHGLTRARRGEFEHPERLVAEVHRRCAILLNVICLGEDHVMDFVFRAGSWPTTTPPQVGFHYRSCSLPRKLPPDHPLEKLRGMVD